MRNYITIRGYVLISTGGQIAALEGMGNLIFELNDASATSAATNGAAVFTGISGTGATNWGSHIIIRNNTIHDTQGECIYIGGSTPDPPGTGRLTVKPSPSPSPTSPAGPVPGYSGHSWMETNST